MRRTYLHLTERYRDGKVIAYQLRQSFKPGEIMPEEANGIGYETASRFLKGKHAFVVATHTDKTHIHNHIIFCATTLDCRHKFRNFLGSGKALARLSDQICMEHKLSVIYAAAQTEFVESIRRFLLHVLPKGFMKIRHYGLLGNRNKTKKLIFCKRLTNTPIRLKEKLPAPQLLQKLIGHDISTCPVCGTLLRHSIGLPPPIVS